MWTTLSLTGVDQTGARISCIRLGTTRLGNISPSFPENEHARLGGISTITLFGASVTSGSGTSVPDGGTSLALFGMGLGGLFTFARCKKKK